jgi:drug/metabolite transporter (DMT)-like permease
MDRPVAAHRSTLVGTGLVVVSAMSYGTVPIAATFAFAAHVRLPVFLAWRFGLAAALLWCVVLVGRGTVPSRARVLALGGMGLAYAAQSAAFFAALQRMSAPTTALLLYTYPAMVTLGASAVFRERLDARKIIAVCVAFAGTSLIVRGQSGGLPAAGVGFALLSAAVYSGYILLGSRLFASGSPFMQSAIVMTGTGAAFVVAAAVGGGASALAGPAQIGWIAVAAIVGTAIPVLAFLAGMPRVGPARASILSTLEPVVTVLLSAVLLAQPLGIVQIVGAACVLGSVVVLEWGRALGPAQW